MAWFQVAFTPVQTDVMQVGSKLSRSSQPPDLAAFMTTRHTSEMFAGR
jgi:hypothetical protein